MPIAPATSIKPLGFPTETPRPAPCPCEARARTTATFRVGFKRIRRRFPRKTLETIRVLLFLLLPDKVPALPLARRPIVRGRGQEPSGKPSGAHGFLLLVQPPGVVLAGWPTGVGVVEISLPLELPRKQKLPWVRRFVGPRVTPASGLSEPQIASAP